MDMKHQNWYKEHFTRQKTRTKKITNKNRNKPKISTSGVYMDILWYILFVCLWSDLHLNDGLCNIRLGVWGI